MELGLNTIAAVIFLGIFAVLLYLPVSWRLGLSLCSSIFQFFTIPVFGFYPSIAMVSSLSLTPSLLSLKRTLIQPPILIFILLLAWQFASLSWSPDKRLGLATIVYEMPFLIIYTISYQAIIAKKENFTLLLKLYALLSIAPLITLILFRFHFDLDADYLQTSLGSTLINPNSIGNSPYNTSHTDFISLWNAYFKYKPLFGNWLIDKPHGFFMNPNTCAAYFGICALLFWGIGSYCRSAMLKVIGSLHWISLFLISSIAAIVLALVLPTTLAMIYLYNKKNGIIKKHLLSILIFSLFAIAGFLFFYPNVLSIVADKMEARLVLWRAAAIIHRGHLFTGLGFGGWQIEYEKYRAITEYHPYLQPNFPPHNTFIQLWTQSGVLALALGLAFMISVMYICWKVYRSCTQSKEKFFSLAIAAAFAWVFLQGMGENWGIVSEMHIQPILAACFALLMSIYYREKAKTTNG